MNERLNRARAGDRNAFDELIAPRRRELLVHCYRMLGSHRDAEDALQNTLVAAWEALGSFDGRSSLRTWLYRVATNHCLNSARSEGRRAARGWDVPNVAFTEPTSLGEVPWLEPIPDALLDERESVSLAFVTALQALPPRQVAVLLLRDVLEFSAAEVAEMLEASLDTVNSLLKRAREELRVRHHAEPAPVIGSPAERVLVEKFMTAWQQADLEAVVALLTGDVFMAMPPMPFQYEGVEVVRTFIGRLFTGGRRYELVPTRANGHPAFAAYLRAPDGSRPAVGLHVLVLSGDRVCELLRFEANVLEAFGLRKR